MKVYPVVIYQDGTMRDTVVLTSEVKAKAFTKALPPYLVGIQAHPPNLSRDSAGLVEAIQLGSHLSKMSPHDLRRYNEQQAQIEQEQWERENGDRDQP